MVRRGFTRTEVKMKFVFNLTHGWNFQRVLRLVLAAVAGYYGIVDQDYLLMFIALVLLYQALWNTGCGMTNNSCTIPPKNSP